MLRRNFYGEFGAAAPLPVDIAAILPHEPGLKEAAGLCRLIFSNDFFRGNQVMAKPATVKIRLVSSADTGFFYVTKKNPRTKTEKLSFNKYDPVVRKHVEFKEAKIK